ncbi:MAG: UDP-N-acetylglucosamine 2-epimerase (non-hydrolyzing) [Proteobacteria bacterium]|nr:UDP-N-acetylglucosamine 2-epimerase (non-hydrolyzing) [Pseudomonadota bacterium]NDC24218.1 UDP-N-acetylglucosamine 2-epimerase (non-hydrolyzing) [Pseudomonadota bacterium]NDD05176.1 UDP-N-acetylglucosamine 2-epimerase (non-hydrolyzing) [Pseudomonadota bacterium]NDG25606.1 UDP-N-acetylglucosamine 2-epimerase (non-hydrolyzing) [Pseudomonadota bacterium]
MTLGKLLILIGTRPEAIKTLPLLKKLKASPEFQVKLGATGQHQELLEQTLKPFEFSIDWNLGIMRPNQSLAELSASCLALIPKIFDDFSPDLVIVQGDTTTATMAALSSFFNRIPVAHIEAGLRTGIRYSPFPEEMNRILLTGIADIHFCPTERSRQNLLYEGISQEAVFVTGNTGIDALRDEWENPQEFPELRKLLGDRKTVLVTAHRRENFGTKMENIFRAIRALADKNPGYQFVYPVHPNPAVRPLAWKILSEHERIILIDPVGYPELVFLMRNSSCILTDSGGIQEEAPTLGIHSLILRDNTERPEALETGFSTLVGTHPSSIFDSFTRLRDQGAFDQPPRWLGGPFGNGHASDKIIHILKDWIKNKQPITHH